MTLTFICDPVTFIGKVKIDRLLISYLVRQMLSEKFQIVGTHTRQYYATFVGNTFLNFSLLFILYIFKYRFLNFRHKFWIFVDSKWYNFRMKIFKNKTLQTKVAQSCCYQAHQNSEQYLGNYKSRYTLVLGRRNFRQTAI